MTKFLICVLFISATVLLIGCGQDSTPTMPQSINQMSSPAPTNSALPSSNLQNSRVVATQGQGGDHHSEQIVFSGQGDSTLGPFGFWVWSQDADSSTPYHGEAAGALYLYALGITSGVEGEVEETSEGIYEITVESRLAGGIDAVLTNVADPVHGPHNTVNVTFSSPQAGTGQSTNAVVNVTGPSD
jgi:hypothetical protein